MKDDNLKNLIKKSVRAAPEDFTDNLMERLEKNEVSQRSQGLKQVQLYRYAILGVLGVVVVFFTLLYFNLTPEYPTGNMLLTRSKTPWLVAVIFLILMGINHMMKIQEEAKLYNNN